MPLITGNPNAVGTSNVDLIFPFDGTGAVQNVNAGDGNDIIFGNRLATWLSVGNANQTYTTPFSIDSSIGWTVGGTANPLVGDPSIPNTTVYAQSVGGGYFCYSINLAAGAQMTLDIDAARSSAGGSFDSYVEVLSASTGAVLAQFDDTAVQGSGGLGSSTIRDSFGQFTASAAGTYIIRVGRYLSNTSSQALQDGDMFALAVSATGHSAMFGATGGNSTYSGEAGDDYLVGYIGNDTLYGGIGADSLYGVIGNDILYGGADDDLLSGGDGFDTANYYGGTTGVTVDLRIAGQQDTIGAGHDKLESIEAINGTDADDTLTGDNLANTLTGNGGDDTLNGMGGDDVVNVGLDADTADGGDGIDLLSFGHTSDNWMVDIGGGIAINTNGHIVRFSNFESILLTDGDDTITSDGDGQVFGGVGDDIIYAANGSNEKLDGGLGGVDTLNTAYFNGNYTINMVTGTTNYAESFTNFENLILGNGNNNIIGTTSDNNIRGGDGVDVISAGAGNDIVEGGGGNDNLNGEGDFDYASYEHNMGGVTVSLALQGGAQNTGGAGNDTLLNFEGLIGSSQSDTLTGDGQANTLIGGAANDTLNGGQGFDIFIWRQGDGNDVIDGGDDDDTLSLRAATSGWQVNLNPGGTATNNDDILTLTSIERVDGSDFDDIIVMANDGGSTVYGYGGNDYISFGLSSPNTADGGEGIDTLDTSNYDSSFGNYYINLETGATNFDEVLLNFENVTSGDTDDIVTGTSGNNTIKTNGGSDRIHAGAGDDIIDGGEGSDTADYSEATAGVRVRLALTGNQDTLGAGTDRLANIENLAGSGYADLLVGSAQANIIDGGFGADEMRGGRGEDIFYVDNIGDKVIEADGEGNDLVYTSVTFSLAGQFIEALEMQGYANINGAGNSLNNRLVGNSGNNILTGAAGNDRLDGSLGIDKLNGGIGNDTYVIDDAGDTIVENNGEGTDTVEAYVSYNLAGKYVENIKLMGEDSLNATGNSLVNILTGNGGDNVLNGLAGADTMAGGAGNDYYYVDNVGDVVKDAINSGHDKVESSVSFSLAGQYIEELILTGSAAINGTGNSLDNHLYGNTGINVLRGESGADNIHGGRGNDTLIGGTGDDIFWFDTTAGATNVDTISDFSVPNDSIDLLRTIFTGIAAAGVLDVDAFRNGTAAVEADDRILYDAATGKIWYDVDGVGGAAAVQFAKVTAGLALTNADFIGV